MAYSTTFNLNRPNRLLVFGVSANQNLNLRDYQITEAGSNLTPTTATNTDSLTAGNIAVPGSILAIPFAGWTRAYSFIAHKGEGDKLSMELAMVSPVHSWLDQQSSQGLADDKKSQTGHTALAGCSDGQDVASLFYIKDSTLQELALNTTSNNNGEPTPIETVKLATKTQLAATAGTNKKRYVAYQLANDGRIEVYHLEKSTPMAKLKSTTDSIDGSPLAIVQFEKGGQSYVRLYYVKEFRDKSRKVVRAQQTLDGEGMSIGDWAYVEMEQSGKHPSTSTSLSAIWVPSVQQVILTYHATGQTGLTSFWDKDTWPLGG